MSSPWNASAYFGRRTICEREQVQTQNEQSETAQNHAVVPVHSEAEKLREAIRDAGFAVMQTSGRWSIHDVSKAHEADQQRTTEVINENIDLCVKVKQLEATIKDAFHLFQAADKERLNGTHAAHDEAEKWKAEGDMYGWNFHQGKSGGMTEASIIFYRVFRRLRDALA